MLKLTSEIKVGIVVIAGIVGIAYMSARVNDAPLFGSQGHTYYADFENIIGIIMKTPVMIAGIRTGYVADIKLHNGKARLTLAGIDPKIIITRDSRLQIRDKGLLGERIIELSLGTDTNHIIPDRGIIKNTNSFSELDQIFNRFSDVGEMMPKFDRIASNIEEMTNNLVSVLKVEILSSTVPDILENLKNITVSIQDMMADLHQSIKKSDEKITNVATNVELFTKDLRDMSSENIKAINHIIGNFEEISHNLNDVIGSSDERINSSVQNVKEATSDLKQSLASLKGIMERVERGEGTIGKLLSDEAVVEKLETTIDGVNTFIETVNRIETSIGYRGEFLLTDTQELQNYVQLKIQPRPDKFFLIEFVDEPLGDEMVTENTITVDDGTPITTRTSTRDDAFTFSVQFAKRFYDFNIRFGVIRSEGGVGFDYYLFDDHFYLSVDAFDFSRETRPHVRAFLNIDLWKNILLTAGVDDLLRNGWWDTPYDFFVGGGIHFTDEDLKSVMAALPIPGM
ncbi:MAG: MlaD family protein [Pseudomonadota bacterium]